MCCYMSRTAANAEVLAATQARPRVRALRAHRTIGAEYRAEQNAGLEPWLGRYFGGGEWLPVLGGGAATLSRLDELDRVAIRVFEPR